MKRNKYTKHEFDEQINRGECKRIMNVKVKMYDGETGRTAKVNFEGADLDPMQILQSMMAFISAHRIHASIAGPDQVDVGQPVYVKDFMQPKGEATTPEPYPESWEGPEQPSEDWLKAEPEAEQVEEAPRTSLFADLREKGLLTGPSLVARFPLDYEPAVMEARQMEGAGVVTNGIRFDAEGHPMFQTRYLCTCGKKSRRYVYNKSSYCASHCCNVRLKIEYASNKNLRDVDGNYYKAMKVYQG